MLWAAAYWRMISSWFSGEYCGAQLTCGRTAPRETAPTHSRMLKQGSCWPPIQPRAFVKAALKKLLYFM